jgi:hypothetical protein
VHVNLLTMLAFQRIQVPITQSGLSFSTARAGRRRSAYRTRYSQGCNRVSLRHTGVPACFQRMFFTGMRPEEAIAIRWSDRIIDASV